MRDVVKCACVSVWKKKSVLLSRIELLTLSLLKLLYIIYKLICYE